ncbi:MULTISPECIES: fumarylacetoacetate hydrolase family protein [unclassified Arthrobacter]|uniref:fumarylacetoacetate hydrolase family protein n=1 Tax=unclassified Arthrobacter TaxID=235627 RepID=UPI0011B0D942
MLMHHHHSFMTLRPGTVVLTGLPARCRQNTPGDEVFCRVQGISELRNRVIAGSYSST